MNLSGYDRWKTTEPDPWPDCPRCEACGLSLRLFYIKASPCWFCERCDDDTINEETP